MRHESISTTDSRWTDFLARHRDAEIFHRPVWSSVLVEAFGGDALAFVLFDREERLVAGLPLILNRARFGAVKAVCLPYTDLCGPLAENTQAFDALSAGLADEASRRGWESVVVKWPLGAPGASWAQDGQGTRGFRHVTPLVEDADRVFAGFKKSQVQQRIRRAERAGVSIVRGDSLRELKEFYRLHTQTRSRLGALVQPSRFFRVLWNRVITAGLGRLLLARHEGKTIAAALFLHWNGHVHYLLGASDTSVWGLRPNNLLLWEAIRDACGEGYESFDWGFTDLGNKGLRDFKRGWGSEESEFHHTWLVGNAPVRSRLSPYLATMILRTPPWVCRLAGESLFHRLG